jgi:hypothetical protein
MTGVCSHFSVLASRCVFRFKFGLNRTTNPEQELEPNLNLNLNTH